MLSMFETTKQGTIAMKKLTSAVLGGVTMLALASQAGATPLFDAITGQTSYRQRSDQRHVLLRVVRLRLRELLAP